MTRDRLASLEATQDSDNANFEDGPVDIGDGKMEHFFEEVNGVRVDMERIRTAVEEVGVKHDMILSKPRCEERMKVVLLIQLCVSRYKLFPKFNQFEENCHILTIQCTLCTSLSYDQ